MLTFDDVVIRNGAFRLTVELSVEPGSRNAIIGPSGAGKSTLLHGTAGFLRLDSGRIGWQGRDIAGLAPADRPMSIVFQDQNLFPHLTAFQNVALGIRPSLRLDAGERAAVEARLDRVGLGGLGERKPRALSGGQQSRLALARVALRKRPILLLDEPFSALGPALRIEMLELVAEIAVETAATVLMVTHDPADARRITPSTIVVAGGRAEPPRPTMELLDNPPESLREYLGAE
jgi:thiamine transport system ATP-binding protein